MSSRSRPRNGSTKGDSGEQEEEQQIWESIKSGLRDLSEIQKKQISIFDKIKKLEEEVAERAKTDEGGATDAELKAIQDLYRENLKLAENEKRMLDDTPHDIINRLTILKAMREASNEAQTLSAPVPNPRSLSNSKVRKPKPLQRPTSAASSQAGTSSQAAATSVDKDDADSGNANNGAPGGGDGASDTPGPIPGRLKASSSAARSPSVASRRGGSVDRDSRLPDDGPGPGPTGSESSRGTAAERAGKLVKGAEVAYKQSKPKEDGSQWIQCVITHVQSEKTPRRYEVQDMEPEEKGAACAKYRTTAQTLIAIPATKDSLPDYPFGKRVLARYPDTTTFYDAEVLGNKKEKGETWCILRFEDDQDKELRVLRRYVLDVGGK